jgi:putative ABC transport system substrate-binding protein
MRFLTNSLCMFAIALAALIIGSHAQWSKAEEKPPQTARVGFVDPYSRDRPLRGASAFWKRLSELGYVQGRNLVAEVRWANGESDRLSPLMRDVLSEKIDVLVTYSTPAALAAKKATTTVPIVVVAMGDPIGTGLASSLARPGGNLTGLSMEFTDELSGKWLEILGEVVPDLSTAAVISNPNSPLVRNLSKHLSAAAGARKLKLRFINVGPDDSLDTALTRARREAQAALVLPDPFTVQHRKRITALAAKNQLPTIYMMPDFIDAGGLIAYSVSNEVLFRRAAEYVDRILRGARAGELPIEQPTQFSLAVNLKAAQALGVTIPESILLRADEVVH